MTTNRHQQLELEGLSAYLDHQLNEAEKKAFRSRLAEDASLRQQLDDLRQICHILRNTPTVKRPRSFILSPEMVQKQKTAFRMMNFSRLVSAAAAVLLLAVIGGQFLLSSKDIGQLASAPMDNIAFTADKAAEADMMEEPMAMEGMAEEEPYEPEAAEMAPAGEPADDMDGVVEAEMEEAPATDSAAEEVMGEEPQMTVEPGGGDGESFSDSDEEGLGASAQPTETKEQARNLPTDKALDQTGEETDGQAMEATEGVPLPPSEETVLEPIPVSRIVQGALLLLAVLGGLAAAYFRKKIR